MLTESEKRSIRYIKEISQGSYAAFIDGSADTNLAFKPEFVSSLTEVG